MSGIDDFQTSDQTVGRIHGNGANNALAQMLGNFKHQFFAVVVTFQSGQNVRQFVDILKLNVNNRAHNLRNMSELTGAPLVFLNLFNLGGSGIFFLFQFLNRLGVKFGNTRGLFSAGRFFRSGRLFGRSFCRCFLFSH